MQIWEPALKTQSSQAGRETMNLSGLEGTENPSLSLESRSPSLTQSAWSGKGDMG